MDLVIFLYGVKGLTHIYKFYVYALEDCFWLGHSVVNINDVGHIVILCKIVGHMTCMMFLIGNACANEQKINHACSKNGWGHV